MLDELKYGLDDEDEPEAEITNRTYWEKRATPEMLKLTDHLLKIVNEVEPKAVLRYVKQVIGIGVQKDNFLLPLYFIHFLPFRKWVLLQIKLPQNEEADKQLDEAGLDVRSRGRKYELRISGPVNDKQQKVLLTLFRQAAEADAK